MVEYDLFELDEDVCEWNDGKEEKQWAMGFSSKRLNKSAQSKAIATIASDNRQSSYRRLKIGLHYRCTSNFRIAF